MIIDLANAGTTSRPLAADIEGETIDLADEGKVIGTAHFEGEMFRGANKTHLRGNITADVEVNCTRCLAEIARPIDVSFEDVFVDVAEAPKAKDLELEDADLDVEIVVENEIDLTDVVREQILLDLPDQVLCKEDCKGLCPQCGADRNLIDCSCEEDDIDPRWAALKKLN
ncbi:MAG TPA: DUF177 domain-containing protein [Pyrinomonadaceae bacterium]|jgi:uncharacterized protein|nr:DUF177 domain-containing protein [Pyrinomonadaceae bacterium]